MELRVIEKEVTCRVGQDWHTKELFIGELMGLHREITYLACEELKVSSRDLHDLTCSVVDMDKLSATGDHYLAKKVLRLKVKVILEDCRLEDDKAVPSPFKKKGDALAA